ncbi:MAG: hypothetical protein H6669_06100 [Ardenticatenaceae bacterium]|nr:hypothetical protein [Ardenticatenaceae bacterium]
MKKTLYLFTLLFLLSACKSELTTPTSRPWTEYENALAEAILHEPGLCEWEIWGQQGQEVYVWAECQMSSEPNSAASGPAVVYLATDGTIEKVVIPHDGINYGPDIEELFPQDVQTLINSESFDAVQAMKHIEIRQQNPSILPMIVEAGVTLP